MKSKKIKLSLNPELTEEFLLDQEGKIDEIMALIANRLGLLNPPQTSHYKLFVTGYRSRVCHWGTIVKNLTKEQTTLSIDPPINPNELKSPRGYKPSTSTTSEKNEVKDENNNNSNNNKARQSIRVTAINTNTLFGGLIETHFPTGTNEVEQDTVPPIVGKLLAFLKQDQVQRTVGILRLTGSPVEKERYIRLFNDVQKNDGGNLTAIVFPNSLDPNVVANLFLEYFKKLDRPLLYNFSFFVDVFQASSDNERIRLLKKAIDGELEPIYRNTFKAICYYFAQLLLYSEENRLSIKSLSIIFGPLLFREKLREEEEISNIKDIANEKKISATKMITTKQISPKMIDFYIKTIGFCIEHYSSVFDEDGHSEELHTASRSSTHQPEVKNLSTFLQRLKETKTTTTSTTGNNDTESSSSNSASGSGNLEKVDKTKWFAETANLLSNSDNDLPPGLREPKKPTNLNDESEWQEIQKQWMSFVDSWKKKYLEEKTSVEKLHEDIQIKQKEFAFEKEQIREQIRILKEQLEEKNKVVSSKRREWEIQRENILLAFENEKIDMEKERSKRNEEIQEIKDQFKRTLEYYKVTNVEIDDLEGDDEDDEIERIAKSTEEKEEQLKKPTTLTAAVGSKINVDSRFRKRQGTSPNIRLSTELKEGEEEVEENKKSIVTSDLMNELENTNNNNNEEEKKNNSKPIFAKKEEKEEEKSDPNAKLCVNCKKKIIGEYRELPDGNMIHTYCFVCCNCNKEIDGPFFKDPSTGFWCAPCIRTRNSNVVYQTKEPEEKKKPTTTAVEMKCAACSEMVTSKTDLVKCLGKAYHKACFVCQKCASPFENMKFYDLNGVPVCANCKRISIKAKVK
ncbi:hypothetical protein ABK040_010368 [Willaertia magna]